MSTYLNPNRSLDRNREIIRTLLLLLGLKADTNRRDYSDINLTIMKQ